MLVSHIEELGDGLFFVCAGEATRQLRIQAELLAQAKTPVLIMGEKGSGKGTAARLIHKLAGQACNHLLMVDCAEPCSRALDRALFGADTLSPGEIAAEIPLFERRTILLRNIVGLIPSCQAQILNWIVETANRRPTGGGPGEFQVRILATCSPGIETSVADGSFSAELYSYLSAFTIYIPPLRSRKDEISLLLSHFMNTVASKYDLPPRLLSSAAHCACQSHSWPGDIKELEDFVKRYLIMGDAAIGFEQPKSVSVPVTGVC